MRRTVFAVLALVGLAAAVVSSLFTPAVARAEGGNANMKGWELYSWTDEACYGVQLHSEVRTATCYALLPGTNREKTVAEIKKEPLHLYDLKKKFAELRKGEELFWLSPTAAFN